MFGNVILKSGLEGEPPAALVAIVSVVAFMNVLDMTFEVVIFRELKVAMRTMHTHTHSQRQRQQNICAC